MITILGGGPAGRIASIRLAGAGRDVQLIEQGGIGGQCLHLGCMPVCALNDVARILRSSRFFSETGIFDQAPRVDYPALIRQMRETESKIASVLDHETRLSGVRIVYGKSGRFEEGKVVLDGSPVTSEAVILATGSEPFIPPIEGRDRGGVYTSHSIWGMPDLPDQMVIIGGGIMAAEFAYIYRHLGSRVTIISRSRFLKDLDEHLRSLAIRELEGVRILEDTPVRSIGGDTNVRSVTAERSGQDCPIVADAVLLATGLVPRSGMIKGVAKGPGGEVIVDDHMRTSLPGIYAAGDVTGPPYLTPVARHQGIVAADNILGRDRRMDYRFIPQSLNLTHELAFCGDGGTDAASLTIPGPAGPGSFWSVPAGDTGLARIMADPDSGEIRGICSAGPGGGLIAGYMAFLMQRHVTVHDFEDFIEVHPSTDGLYGLARYASEVLKRRG